MSLITPFGDTNSMMNQNDIDNIARLLNTAIRNRDWDFVSEAQEYIEEFQEEPIFEEE